MAGIETQPMPVSIASVDSMPFTMKSPDRLIIIQAFDKDGNKRVLTFSYDNYEWFSYGFNKTCMMHKFHAHLMQILRMDNSLTRYKADGYKLVNGAYENCMDFLPQDLTEGVIA